MLDHITDPKPPSHLSPSTQTWWRAVVATYELDASALTLLSAAAECWDRACAARTLIAKEGLTYTDRFGAPRKHPACGIELDAKRTFDTILKQLGLPEDDGPKPMPGSRPHRRRTP